MQNNSKLNTVLLVILIMLVLGIGILFLSRNKAGEQYGKDETPSPSGYTQTNTNQNGPDYFPNGNPADNDNTQGSKVTLDMSSPYAKTYTTLLTQALNQPANFDGHYTVAEIGCGSGCSAYYVLDKNTGKVYKVPESNDWQTFNVPDWQPYSISGNTIKVVVDPEIKTYSFDGSAFHLDSTFNGNI